MNKKKGLSKPIKFDFKTFSLVFLMDLCFFLIFGLIAFQLLNSAAPSSVLVSNMLKLASEEMQRTGQLFTRDDVFNLLASNEEFIRAYGNVFNSVVLSIIAFIVLYIISQSISWWICDKKRLGFWKYFYRFSLISLIWFLLLIVILFSYLNAVSSIDSLFIPGILRAAYAILLIVTVFFMSYFLVICYYFIKEKTLLETVKKTFIVGIAKFNKIFWKFLLIGIGKIGLFVLVLLIYSFSYNLLLGLVLFVLLVITYITWAKIKIVSILDRV